MVKANDKRIFLISGDPYSVVIAPNGKTFPTSSAQPYSVVRAIIELMLKER